MRSQFTLDEIFRKRLSNHSEAPPMHVFDAVMAQRDVKKRRIPMWIILTGAAILLAVSSWVILSLTQPETEVELDSFPVPLKLADNQSPATSPVLLQWEKASLPPA